MNSGADVRISPDLRLRLQAKISRWLVITLALTFIQLVAAPILAPILTTTPAAAADANPFPSGLTGVIRYVAESYTAGASTWSDINGANPIAIAGTAATKVVNTAGTLGASSSVTAVQGSYATTMLFPTAVIVDSNYTLFYIARYAPQQAGYTTTTSCVDEATHGVAGADKRNRIFSSFTGNWLSGFWGCASGVAYHEGWLTQNTNAVTELSGTAGNNWLLGADCGYTVASTSTCKGRYRAFGKDQTVTPNTDTTAHRIAINQGGYPTENSDFQIAEVIALPTILQTADVIRVETYLSRAYGIPLSANAATKLGLYTASVGSTLGTTFTTQPQIAIQDANGQTVTTDNSTIITATISGANGVLLGTRTATAIRGVATFADLSVTGTAGTSYTITYSSNTSLTTTAETRSFTRASRTIVLALSKSTAAYGETETVSATVATSPSSNSDGTLTFSVAANNACSVNSTTGVVTITRPFGTCLVGAVIGAGATYDTATATSVAITISTPNSDTDTSLTITGAQYAWQSDTGTGGVLDIANAITAEAWVYPTESNANTQYSVINKAESFQLFHYGGIWKYALSGGSTWGSGISTGVSALLNEWHHVAFTRAASTNTVNFYVDGNLVYTGTANGATTGALTDNTNPFAIGAMVYAGPTPSFQFKGKIDQVEVFDIARSSTDIQSDMQSYLSASTSGLRMYYDFNEASGSALFNRITAANSTSDLTIVGTGTWNDVKTVISDANYTTINFPRTYLTANGGWKVPTGVVQVAAVVAAGGGGGNGETDGTGWLSGGGGAGGYKYVTTNVTADSIQPVQVGQGGRAGLNYSTQTLSISAPTNGGDSTFANVSSLGGGYGGGRSLSGLRGAAGGAGGSGGGGGTYSGAGGTGTSGQGKNGGTSGPSCCAGAGGGGAGSNGGSTSGTTGGDAGSGVLNPLYISGANAQYLAGGGAGGGSGINGSAGTMGGVAWKTTAPANTGSGGGGGGGGSTSYPGGFGGSGVIIIKFLISTSKPIYTGPNNDTTTAGLTYTFIISGNAPSPLVRTFLWQSSTDTGTTWSNISIGSGFTSASYTTPILETSTSGLRYQYRVIVTDSETYTSLVDTSTGVYLIINPRIVITGSYTTYKYGAAHTDTFTVNAATGTGVKTITRTSSAKAGITWDTSTANIARVSIAASLVVGTYYDTLTVIDEETATTVLPITITVLKADTATILVSSRVDTYTASSLSYTDTFTATGLVAGDSLTAVTYLYSGTANDGTTFNLAARPAIAGTYTIIPSYTLVNASNYESVTVTYGQLTINRALRMVSVTARPNSLKYGETSTAITTAYNGSSDGSLSYLTSTPANCAFTGLVLQAIEASGACTFAARISRGNNYETGTSTDTSTTLTLADTITVTVQPLSAITYTGSSAFFTPRISVSGLVYTDTTTSTSATFTFKSATAGGTFSSTYPINSDSYTVRADTLTVTSGLLSRYRNVVYVDGLIRINRAQQSPLIIPQYVATFGSPYNVLILGGSGTGAFTETVTSGTASSCVFSGDTVTTTTQGTCLLSATRAQDQNYETATVSGYIYFLIWSVAPTPTIGSGTVIALNSEVSITRDPFAAPTITSVGTSADFTYTVQIKGAGFTASSKADMAIKFGRTVIANSDFQVIDDNTINAKPPYVASPVRILVSNGNGAAVSIDTYITPVINNA